MVITIIFLVLGICCALILGVVAFTSYSLRKGEYDKPNRLLKRLPFLADSSGYIHPALIAYISLKARDLEHAEKVIDAMHLDDDLEAIYLLRIALFGQKADWKGASAQLDALSAIAAAESLDISALEKLRLVIDSKDANAVLDYFEIKGFGSVKSPLHQTPIR